MTDIVAEIVAIKKQLEALTNESIKNRRNTEDALLNLDFDNMPSVRKRIDAINSWQLTVDNGEGAASVASILAQAYADSSSISLMAYYVDPYDGITSHAAASLVASINGSEFNVEADRIDFTGFTTFALADDLDDYAPLSGLSGGTTTINGNCITAGVIDTALLKVDGYGYSSIPNLHTQNIASGDDNSLSLYSYMDIDITAANGDVYLSNPTYYNYSEIATLADLEDIVPVFG